MLPSRVPPMLLATNSPEASAAAGASPIAPARVAESGHQHFLARGYFPALDGLRGLAICAVLWHHALPRATEGWLGRGHVGVRLFFALSGFLISTRLCAERRATGEIALGYFWLRRALRIFPLYYAVLALFALLLGLRPGDAGSRHFFENLVFHATYTSNWFVDYAVAHPVWFAFGWSLATEEQFYAWWPVVLRGSRRGRTAWLALLGVLLLQQLVAYRSLGGWLVQHALLERVLLSLAPALSLGALLALILERRAGFALAWALLGRAPGLVAGVLLVSLGFLLVSDAGAPVLLDLGFALLVASAVLAPQSWLGSVLAARPLSDLGRISYGIYLFHVPLLGVLRRGIPWLAEQPGLLFVVALGLSASAAALSYRWFEAPLLALAPRRFSVTVDRSGPGPVLAWGPTDSRRLET
jgi:peptidoglycan/LPS O-acetylase OafA/YrhL